MGPSEKQNTDWLREPPFRWKDVRDNKDGKYILECYCKRVQFILTANPKDVKVCHCDTCKVLHGAPMQTAAIFDKTAAHLTKGNEAQNRSSDNNPHLTTHPVECPRKLCCATCGSPLADEGRNMLMIFPSSLNVIRDGDVEVCRQDKPSPTRGVLHGLPAEFGIRKHIFYSQRAFDILDGIEKWEGLDGKSRRLRNDGTVIDD